MTNKKIIEETIFTKSFRGDSYVIRFSDLPKNIQENDIIDIIREESFYSENESWDAFTELQIIREREETENEYKKRISEEEKQKERMKKLRYETYLKLRKEFENE